MKRVYRTPLMFVQLDEEQGLKPNARRLLAHIGVRPAGRPVIAQPLQALIGGSRSSRPGVVVDAAAARASADTLML